MIYFVQKLLWLIYEIIPYKKDDDLSFFASRLANIAFLGLLGYVEDPCAFLANIRIIAIIIYT